MLMIDVQLLKPDIWDFLNTFLFFVRFNIDSLLNAKSKGLKPHKKTRANLGKSPDVMFLQFCWLRRREEWKLTLQFSWYLAKVVVLFCYQPSYSKRGQIKDSKMVFLKETEVKNVLKNLIMSVKTNECLLWTQIKFRLMFIIQMNSSFCRSPL